MAVISRPYIPYLKIAVAHGPCRRVPSGLKTESCAPCPQPAVVHGTSVLGLLPEGACSVYVVGLDVLSKFVPSVMNPKTLTFTPCISPDPQK